MAAEQNLKNHVRTDPAYHLVLFPLLLANLIFTIYFLIHHWHRQLALHIDWIVVAVALLLMGGIVRTYSLKVQTRIIRLEERLRIAALVPAADQPLTAKLTESQLVALRFASDEEFASLAIRAAAGNLSNKQIKQAITSWRADHFRV